MTSAVPGLRRSLTALFRGRRYRPIDSFDAAGICTHPLVIDLARAILAAWQPLDQLRVLNIPRGMERVRGAMDGAAVQIHNCCFRARGLRKLHLEVASLGPGLNILHAVMFPDPCWDLPIFGSDLVTARGQVTAAVLDLSPTGDELPAAFRQQLQELSPPRFSQPRQLPHWGDIFSPWVHFVKPTSPSEEATFLQLAATYLELITTGISRCRPDPPHHPASLNRQLAQIRYCRQQQCNDKTRRVLAKAFGNDWADDYIRQVLFDEPTPPTVVGRERNSSGP